MHTFYTQVINQNKALLDNEEAHHLVQVLRLKVGEEVVIIDGNGNEYLGLIEVAHKKEAIVAVKNILRSNVNRPYCSIAICPTKNIDRLEYFIEKSTEIGIDEIFLLLAQRSERKIVNIDRLKKVVLSATKQSGQLFLPKLNELVSFKDFMSRKLDDLFAFKGIGHCIEQNERYSLDRYYKKGDKALFLVGPEGDFTQEEVDLAMTKHFKPISLGNSRLRVETAGLVACTQFNFLNNTI